MFTTPNLLDPFHSRIFQQHSGHETLAPVHNVCSRSKFPASELYPQTYSSSSSQHLPTVSDALIKLLAQSLDAANSDVALDSFLCSSPAFFDVELSPLISHPCTLHFCF